MEGRRLATINRSGTTGKPPRQFHDQLLAAAVVLGYLHPRSLIVATEDEPDLIKGNAVALIRMQ
jgi:hypothetical protein